MIFCTHLFKREVLRGFLQLYSYLFAISDTVYNLLVIFFEAG